MKTLGNICYAMGIVVALGIVLTLVSVKPVEDVIGAYLKCTHTPVDMPCSTVYVPVLGPDGQPMKNPDGTPVQELAQPKCAGDYTVEKSITPTATKEGAGPDYDVCTELPFCNKTEVYRPANWDCSPE